MHHYEKLQLYLKLRLKLKKIHHVLGFSKIHHALRFNQSQWLQPYVEFSTQKRIEAEKKWRQRLKSIVQINEQCHIQ